MKNKGFRLYSLHDESKNSFKDITGAYINNFPQENSPYSLVLFNNNSLLSDSCVSDFLSLIKNDISLAGQLYVINSSSNGYVSLQRGEYSLIRDPNIDNIQIALVFKDETKDQAKYGNEQVVEYLDINANITFSDISKMQLVGNDLYYINKSGKLSLIDIFSKKIQMLDLPEIKSTKDGVQIQTRSFFIYGNRLFYVAGRDCEYNGDGCDFSLHEYNLESKQDSTLVSGGIISGNIMGYDTVGNKLYMSSLFADDSHCGNSLRILYYDFTTKIIKEAVFVYDYDCSGDGPTVETPELKKVGEIYNILEYQMNEIRHIKIENGKIAHDTNPNGAPYGIGIRYVSK